MISIFDAKTHYEYLRERLKPGLAARGAKAKLSAFMRVQAAFLSQVLTEKSSLNLEHADLANQFFDHSSEESQFFILLVCRDRAGTSTLKRHFNEQIISILKKRSLITERLGQRQQVSEDAKGVYYSSWIYPAIHLMCSIEGLNTRRSIQEKLNLPLELVGKALDFLEQNQLLKKDGDVYHLTHFWIRLESDSPHIVKHHANWRQRAIQNLEGRDEQDLHYSGVFSIDFKMSQRLKDRLLEVLKEEMKSIEAARSEDLYVLGMDMFKLTKSVK